MASQLPGRVPSRVGCPGLGIPSSLAAPGGEVLLILGPRLGTWCILKGVIGKASVGARLSPRQAAGGSPSWAWCVSSLGIEWYDNVFPLQRSELRGRPLEAGPESSGSLLSALPPMWKQREGPRPETLHAASDPQEEGDQLSHVRGERQAVATPPSLSGQS